VKGELVMFELPFLVFLGISLTVFLWAFYNVPILVAGVRNLFKGRKKRESFNSAREYSPTFSIIVPVKNEEKVVTRLLNSLSNLNYPEEKMEIVIVEDGSSDRTFEMCQDYAEVHANVKILHRDFSDGKPSALNYGIMHSKGEIVAIFDADNIPDSNALDLVSRYFEDSDVAAVQGKTLSINSKENMLTQFISYESAVYSEVYLRGKDVLGLFVHLTGSCQFVRRSILSNLEGFDENVLSEDIELSARLTENNFKIRYAPDVVAWQESPSTVKTLFKQRTRWFRGVTELAFRYGKLMAKPNWRNLDAEVTLFAPFILIASLLPYIASSYAFLVVPFDVLWSYAVLFALFTTTLTVSVCGFALVYVTKPRKARNVLWLPFVYLYWSLQAFIALYAVLLIIFRRPKRWSKTDRTGTVTDFSVISENKQDQKVIYDESVV
jgi:cellulose synthase/poly-beta-1,6-N-acetylglucosamine synthase-like glycosyltransferase